MQEDNEIKRQLKLNSYPASIINQCHYKINNSDNIANHQQNNQNLTKYIKTPYIKGVSEKISKILKPHNIKLAMKPTCNIKSIVSHVKDKIEILENNSTVYKIPCASCNANYIGETSRQLKIRINEHRKNVQQNYDRSQIVQHVNNNNHRMNWDEVEILSKSKNTKSRKILESIHSNVTPNCFNRYIEIPQTYINLAADVLRN